MQSCLESQADNVAGNGHQNSLSAFFNVNTSPGCNVLQPERLDLQGRYTPLPAHENLATRDYETELTIASYPGPPARPEKRAWYMLCSHACIN